MKRYTLTEQGKAFYEEQTKTREEMSKKLQCFGPFGPPFGSFPGPMGFEFYSEKPRELRLAMKQLFRAMGQLREGMRANYSEEAVREATKALEEAVKRIEDVTKKLKE